MLKIYNAYTNQGEIRIDDHILFVNGQFDTGVNGFGVVQSANISCTKAYYELQSLEDYRKYLQNIKLSDGYVQKFMLWNPVDLQMLEKYQELSKDFKTYEHYNLNEEGILLFTDYIRLSYPNDGSVKRIFGRYPDNGMYLVMPDASLTMTLGTFGENIQENYEVLQSKKLGRQLALTKMNRKI